MVSKLSEIWSGLFIPDPDPGSGSRIRILIFYPSRIQGSKRHRIPDPDPQHWRNGSTGKKAHLKQMKKHQHAQADSPSHSTAKRDSVKRGGGGVSWPGTTTWELFMGNCASVFVARNTTSEKVEAKMFLFAKMAYESVQKGIFYKGKNSIQHFF